MKIKYTTKARFRVTDYSCLKVGDRVEVAELPEFWSGRGTYPLNRDPENGDVLSYPYRGTIREIKPTKVIPGDEKYWDILIDTYGFVTFTNNGKHEFKLYKSS